MTTNEAIMVEKEMKCKGQDESKFGQDPDVHCTPLIGFRAKAANGGQVTQH